MKRQPLIYRNPFLRWGLVAVGLLAMLGLAAWQWMSAVGDGALPKLDFDVIVLIVAAVGLGAVLFGVVAFSNRAVRTGSKRARGSRPFLKRMGKAIVIGAPVGILAAAALFWPALRMAVTGPTGEGPSFIMLAFLLALLVIPACGIAAMLIELWPPLMIHEDRELRKAARDGARGESDTTPARG